MTDDRAGRLIATVRRHLSLRQSDVGRMAKVDQTVVSLIERGQLERVSLARFRQVCAALSIEPVLDLRWRNGLVDRLIDRVHAAIVEVVVAELRALGWEVLPEFTFNVYGERGSVDVLAWHPAMRALLIVEVKSRLTDLQAMLMSISRKIRLVPPLVADERGWERLALGRIVVMADTRANRATVAAHRSTFESSFPSRTVEARRWLRSPTGDLAGLWFVPVDRDPALGMDRRRRISQGRARVA